MKREELINAINRMILELNDARLKNVYQFVLHISK